MTTALVLLVLIAGGFLAFALCGAVLFWYETLNTPDRRIPSPRPGVRTCLRQFFVSLGGYVLCVGLFPLGPFLSKKPGRIAKGENPDRRPVILVHGLNNNAAVWLYSAAAWRQKAIGSRHFPTTACSCPVSAYWNISSAICGRLKRPGAENRFSSATVWGAF